MIRSRPLWLGALVAITASTSVVRGDFWDGNGAVPPSGAWDLGLNWADNTMPGNSDTAMFNLATAYTARLFANPPAIQALTVSNGFVTFESDSSAIRTLSITSASGSQDVLVTGASTFVTLGSEPFNRVHLIAGDELSVQNDASLTAQSGSDITADRFSSFGLNGSILIDGSDGDGTMLTLTSAGADNFVGRSGNTGYLFLVNDSNSNSIAGNLGLGDSLVANSSGFVFIINGSTLSLNGNLTLANRNVSGQVASLDIYDAGSSLTQSGASSITVGSASFGTADINIGASGSGGTLTTGTGTFTINRTGIVTIGSGGNSGTLNANGNVLIDGGTITRSNGSNFNLAAGRTMTIQAGGLFDVSGTYSADAAYIVTGAGSSWTNSLSLLLGVFGNGSLTVSAGGAVSNTNGSVGRAAGRNGTVTVTGAGSSWINSSTLYVGEDGTGTLTISAGGAVSNSGIAGYVGHGPDGDGTVLVTGAGSTWTNSSELNVGYDGTGSLTIENGGAVSNTDGVIGFFLDSEGDVTVTGAGSTWTNSGSLTIGDLGTGTLTIEDGGAVSGGSTLLVGTNGVGNVTVTGAGSRLTSAGFGMRIGFFASGTLTIAEGGAVSNSDDAFVGISAGSNGEVTVSGAGSTWTIADQLTVGHESTGSLTIAQGGAVSNTLADVGRSAGGNGTVTVDGAGSTWASTSLNVGGSLTAAGGSGHVNVKSGGLVKVNGDTIVWNNGIIELQSGGTFDAHGTIQMNGGTFDFLGGTLHVDTFEGDLKNQGGTLAPGHSAGATDIDGDYFQFAGGTLQIELGGTMAATEFDTLKVTGEATLAGTLEVSLIDSFTPAPGDTFEFLTSGGGINEAFDTELLPRLAGGLFFDVEYSQNEVLLFTNGVLGDYNFNGKVDAADYVVWRKMVRQFGSGLPADGDGNGQVDLDDLDVWRTHFGETAGSGSAGASPSQPSVPEPGLLVLILLGLASLSFVPNHGRSAQVCDSPRWMFRVNLPAAAKIY